MSPVGLGLRGAGGDEEMKPIRERGGALNDLLERLLNKGVVIDLDLVIGVAGIPLIVNCRPSKLIDIPSV